MTGDPRHTLAQARRRRAWRSAATVLTAALLLGVAAVAGSIFGAFSATTASSGNTVDSAADYSAPTASRSVIGKTIGGTPGYIKQGGTYYVYGEVADNGNPPSGISTVTSNTSTLTTGATTTSLASGSFSTGGLTYNRRTASLTANAVLTQGTYSYTITSTDAIGNVRTQNGWTVVVDNTAPNGADLQSANGASIVGRAELNDTFTLTYNEPIDPNSIIAGWDGSQTNVGVQIADNISSQDIIIVYNTAFTVQLPVGAFGLARNDYVAANRNFGSAAGTWSKMTASGNSLNFVLGTASGTTTTAAATGTMIWQPSASAYDRAGNAGTTTLVTETGAADKEF